MSWKKSVSVLPSGYNRTMVQHPVISNGQGVNIMLRRSIPGVFNVLYYNSLSAKFDVTISKYAHVVDHKHNTVITAYLKSDITNALRSDARVRLARPLNATELLEVMNNLRDALFAWPQFTNAADGPVVQVIMSDAPVNWYQAEYEAERKAGGQAYWIGSTESGLAVEKAIIENVVTGQPFRIAEEDQLWSAASARFAEAASGDVRVIL